MSVPEFVFLSHFLGLSVPGFTVSNSIRGGGDEMSLSHDQKALGDASVGLTDKTKPQIRPITSSSHPSPKLRASPTPPAPSSGQNDVACATQTVSIPLLSPVDGGLAAWIVLLAAVLVQALPLGRLILSQYFLHFSTNPSEF
jgi:hypothetical protein